MPEVTTKSRTLLQLPQIHLPRIPARLTPRQIPLAKEPPPPQHLHIPLTQHPHRPRRPIVYPAALWIEDADVREAEEAEDGRCSGFGLEDRFEEDGEGERVYFVVVVFAAGAFVGCRAMAARRHFVVGGLAEPEIWTWMIDDRKSALM